MAVCGIEVDHEKAVLTFGGCLSVICYFIVFYIFYYVNIPNLRRHPTTIAIRKCWFELLFVTQYLWLSFAPNSFFWRTYYNYSDNDDHPPDCEANPNIWPLSWLTQFTLLGSELWFAVFSMDIHVSLTNPFASYAVNDKYYLFFVFGISAITATILVSITPIQYGLSTDPMIWVKDKQNETNWTKVGMFYIYLTFIYIYCGIIAVWSRWQIHRGLEETLRMRQYSVSKQTRYVIGYFMFWTCVYIFQFIIYLKEDFGIVHMSQDTEIKFRSVSAFLLASRGIWGLGIFLIANRDDFLTYFRKRGITLPADQLQEKDPLDEEDQVQLNVALQKEIVRFTALGIQKSVREIDQLLQDSPQRSNSLSSFFFGTKMPGDAISFVVDDPDAFFSPRTISAASADNKNNNKTNNNNESRNPMQYRSSVEERAGREDSTNSVIELTESFGGNGDDDPRVSNASPRAGKQLDRDQRVSTSSTASAEFNRLQMPSVDHIQIDMSPHQPSSQTYDNAHHSNNASPSLVPSSMHRNKSSGSKLRASTIGSVMLENLERIKQHITSPRSSFVFTDYSPKRFVHIRALSGISIESYLQSFQSTTMPEFSEGKSGAFLYFSSDYKYIVKTTTAKEFEKLLQILPQYEKYLEKEHKKQRNPLITRYLGAHRIVMYDIPLYFVVMKNCCPSVDEKYDLKGSWVNRHGSKLNKDPRSARPKKNYAVVRQSMLSQYSQSFSSQSGVALEDGKKGNATGNAAGTADATKKENNNNNKKTKEKTPLFLDNDLQNSFIIHPDDARALAKQIHRDIRFLESFNLMDYSLLIGVRRKTYLLDSNPGIMGSFSEPKRATNAFNRADLLINSSTNSRHEFYQIDPMNRTFGPVGAANAAYTPISITSQNHKNGGPEGEGDESVHTLARDTERGNSSKSTSVTCHAAAVEGAGSFYLGIIDILQEWNWDKWLERFFKTVFLRKDGEGLSAIEPHQYRKRFMNRAVVDIFASLDEVPSDSDDDTDDANNNHSERDEKIVNKV